ncbi:uncharacterized protein LOC100838982 [Brachypodium distachyon]|uniref:Uncharacterized protein n=1 Tax=Brachypodium distachyon TaxID=15368 RepID=A0A0Q3G2H7_BRADI|nr:uncharacterized protein LOC100838982 [Brachypodium distachyon]KQK05520.1 hypothetical protein BRADI_2g20530v3 [Brachypodium distachyon]PNT70960.1 hypothetical protein BRADI_2g20530v3 [Brachypodium distachyon]|eukprot:XP_003566065.2 uncharacterized protein LOC100838982 [Brachypodium distachyon]
MELFKNARSVRLKSHLGTYLCAPDDGAVSHGYRRNPRGAVWAVEPAGEDCVRLQGHKGLYLGATELPADLDSGGRGTRSCCRVVLGSPSCPNDNAFLWSPLREGKTKNLLTLSGPYGRLLRARFGRRPSKDNAVTVDLGADPEESSWEVEVVAMANAAPPLARAPPGVLARFHSTKEAKGNKVSPEEEEEEEWSEEEVLPKPSAARRILYNTARDDGGVDGLEEGTWKDFMFDGQSLVALRRRLEEETRRTDFVVCRRMGARLFPVVLDLPPGNKGMEFILVLQSSRVANGLV